MTNPKHYFTFSFINSLKQPVGWNHEIASSVEQARKQAHLMWDNIMKDTFVDDNSFQQQTDDEMLELFNSRF